MSRDGMHERKCGCLVFQYGPPVLCETHLAKQQKKIDRTKKLEDKGLRKLVRETAEGLGHDLKVFREYPSMRGKWTSYCGRCGDMVIVYEDLRLAADGDQLLGKPLTDKCRRSELVAALHEGTEETDE